MTATFPDGSGYFLYHSIGMFPGKEHLIGAALSEFARAWGTPDDGQWARALQLRGEFIDRWRELINAPQGTLTTTENVTTALYSIINSLPRQMLQGHRVLVAADCFPSLHFLLSGMAQRHGFTLDTVPLRPGETWVRDEDVIARWGLDVSVALLTTVTSTTSYRCDLQRLIEHGKQMGTLVGVDVTQSIGLFGFDVDQAGADFAVSTSLKWLCGTSGAGILQVSAPLLRECRPELRGWFSQENIFSWDIDGFEFAPDARRFDNGTPSVLACVGTLPALRWHAGQDQSALLAHNRSMGGAILDVADQLGLAVASPRNESQRGGMIALRLRDHDAREVVNALRSAHVFADARGDLLRLAPGKLTTAAGVDRLAETLRKVLR